MEAKIISAQSSNIDSLTSRFNRLVMTPLHSRIMLYPFGSLIHTIIDKTVTATNLLFFKKYLFDCFFDNNGDLWDKDFDPVSIVIDTDNLDDYTALIKFRNGTEVEVNG